MTTLEHKIVKTRASHKCWGCRRKFPAGTDLLVSVTVTENDPPCRTYWCETCETVLGSRAVVHDGYDEGWGYGDLIDNYPDEWAAEAEKGTDG